MTIFSSLIKINFKDVISEEIDPAKNNDSKECMICHYWFFNHGFEFQDYVCSGYHVLTMLCLNISGIAIITVKQVDLYIIHDIKKPGAIPLLKNSVLDDCGIHQNANPTNQS